MSAQIEKEKGKAPTPSRHTASVPSLVLPATSQIQRYRFSLDDYHSMVEAGVLKADQRVELIEGEVVEMSPIGKLHASCVKRLNALLAARLNQQAIIGIQDPVQTGSFSEPQPDVGLLKYREDFYAARHPRPKDILLVIEVADRTIDYDREVKIPLYARAKIAQAVIANLSPGVVEVYTKPLRGTYTQAKELKGGQALKLQKLPELALTVDEILG
jgi:Uma2 family endonuclease